MSKTQKQMRAGAAQPLQPARPHQTHGAETTREAELGRERKALGINLQDGKETMAKIEPLRAATGSVGPGP